MPGKRRLPMVQAQQAEPDEPKRPPWQWSLFGAGLIGVAWALLSLLVLPLGRWLMTRELGGGSPEEIAARLDAAPAVMTRLMLENLGLHLAALGIASFAGGYVLGRWSPGRPLREAVRAGAGAGAAAIAAVTFAGLRESGLVVAALVVIVPWAAGLAAMGARTGLRRPGTLVGP